MLTQFLSKNASFLNPPPVESDPDAASDAAHTQEEIDEASPMDVAPTPTVEQHQLPVRKRGQRLSISIHPEGTDARRSFLNAFLQRIYLQLLKEDLLLPRTKLITLKEP